MSGWGPAEAALGIDYTVGRGTQKNYHKAYVWLRRAAAQNVILAEYYLGAAYYQGHGVARNVAQANRWWKEARARGHGYLSNVARSCRRRERAGYFTRRHKQAVQSASTGRPLGTSPPEFKRDFPLTCGFYPEISQVLGEQGTAIVHICIGKDGQLLHKPTIARSSGIHRLDAAALRYASATSGRWKPARRKGRPISFCAKLPVRFSISKPGEIAGWPRASSLPQGNSPRR